jgi:hypothetical protein
MFRLQSCLCVNIIFSSLYIFKFIPDETSHIIFTALCLIQISALNCFLICDGTEVRKEIVVRINNFESEAGFIFLSFAKHKLTYLYE